MIITEVERLRWRIWNGKAKDAQISIDRIHALLPSFESEPARKRRRALDAVDRYLHSQSAHLVDYAERHRAGQRVDTALTEGTANFLVNRRMARRSRCAGPGAGPIGCSRSAAPSTTARSAPVSGRNSCRPTTHTRQWRWPPDPQLCEGPIVGGSTPLSATSPRSRQSGKPYNPVSTLPGEGHKRVPLPPCPIHRADMGGRGSDRGVPGVDGGHAKAQ